MPCDIPRPKPTVNEPNIVIELRIGQERERRFGFFEFEDDGTIVVFSSGAAGDDSMTSRSDV